MLHELIEELYAHTTMTLDDVLYIAKSNGITIDASVGDKLTAIKNGEVITFDAITYDDGTIFIFEIE